MTDELSGIIEALKTKVAEHELTALPVPVYEDIKGTIERARWHAYRRGLQDALVAVHEAWRVNQPGC